MFIEAYYNWYKIVIDTSVIQANIGRTFYLVNGDNHCFILLNPNHIHK